MSGQKIIDGLREAVAGNLARVTIDGQTWVREPNPDSALRQALWECPGCAFGFDARHSNADGTYSCPNCAEAALRQALVAAEKALEPFADVDGEGNEDMADDVAVIVKIGNRTTYYDLTLGDLRRAREAHALITEALQRGEKTDA